MFVNNLSKKNLFGLYRADKFTNKTWWRDNFEPKKSFFRKSINRKFEIKLSSIQIRSFFDFLRYWINPSLKFSWCVNRNRASIKSYRYFLSQNSPWGAFTPKRASYEKIRNWETALLGLTVNNSIIHFWDKGFQDMSDTDVYVIRKSIKVRPGLAVFQIRISTLNTRMKVKITHFYLREISDFCLQRFSEDTPLFKLSWS